MDKYSNEDASPAKIKFTLPARIERPQRKSRYTTTTIIKADEESENNDLEAPKPLSSLDPRFDLSSKLRSLRAGLIKDTVPIKSHTKLKPLKGFQWQRNGQLYDPLKNRGKMFRKAISKFAPPYYAYIETLFEMKPRLTPISKESAPDVEDVWEGNHVTCGWCDNCCRLCNKRP